MARNAEKAQSMLYRFRESQAIEMGMGNRVKGQRRPRMASSVSSLRDCERYRGDILRDISRKVSKIQDESLTDYQVRDLNDEINQLMREKRHFETQIVALGGANYKRGIQSMVDDEGKEVPGTRGYKYFGRARELPGVKEMFTKGANAATEESARNASFQMYRNQGTDYYGDNDEMDPSLAEEEENAARKDWESMVIETVTTLGLDPASTPLPPYPSTSKLPSVSVSTIPAESSAVSTKRKATPDPESTESADAEDEGESGTAAKKSKINEQPLLVSSVDASAAVAHQAAMAAAFLSVLDPESLKTPTLPSVDEMGKVLLEVRKKALREEYGV